jgi:hypothetical protein
MAPLKREHSATHYYMAAWPSNNGPSLARTVQDRLAGPVEQRPNAARAGACPFNRFCGTCGEYDSTQRFIWSLGFYVSPPDWHALEFHSPRFGDLRLFGQAPSRAH